MHKLLDVNGPIGVLPSVYYTTDGNPLSNSKVVNSYVDKSLLKYIKKVI